LYSEDENNKCDQFNEQKDDEFEVHQMKLRKRKKRMNQVKMLKKSKRVLTQRKFENLVNN